MDNSSSSERPDVAEGVSEYHDQPKKKIVEEDEWDEEPPSDLDELDDYLERLEKYVMDYGKDTDDEPLPAALKVWQKEEPKTLEEYYDYLERFEKWLDKFDTDEEKAAKAAAQAALKEKQGDAAETKVVGKSRIWPMPPPISTVGFTQREYDVCRSYLNRRTFEYDYPISSEYTELVAYIDQIRQTKGYGVTIKNQGPLFIPKMDTWLKDRKLRYYIGKEMVEGLLDSMFEELQQRYTSLGVTNVVLFNRRLYLLSVSVEEQQNEDEKERATEKEEAKVVEAMVFFQPDPFTMEWKLREWKLKKGPQVVYYSKSAVKLLK